VTIRRNTSLQAPRVAPYGSWKSPISAERIASGSMKLSQIALDGETVYWCEDRPGESGRTVLVRWHPRAGPEDFTPALYSVRSRVHEYGGGSFVVSNGTVYFTNFADQRIYRQEAGGEPLPVTVESARRFADGVLDSGRHHLIWVCEDHSAGSKEPANSLVSIPLEHSSEFRTLVSGNDFYSSPRLSPNGAYLAWLTWNHPNMPWDGTELWVGELASDGSLMASRKVVGGAQESIVQPEWSPDGFLYFISDRTGWWNLHRWREGHVEALCTMEAEFARPQWVFAMSTYGFASTSRILCTFSTGGVWRLGILDTLSGELERIDTPYTDISYLQVAERQALFCGGSPTLPQAIVRMDLSSQQLQVVRQSAPVDVPPEYLSIPETLEFQSTGSRAAYAFYYPPLNPLCRPPAGELPPLLVRSHGGPTAASSTALSWDIQYWTSRGIAVLDVNYGGSTGYGRQYRDLLYGQWGVADVEDCVNGARFVVQRGRVDGNRLAIRGGSAGGYTTLCALTFYDLFKAGASYYGVSDLETLARDTHKFEAHYLDRLIGPYPEQRELYLQRSPIHFTHRLSCPLIIFQGLDDRVVPPNQAETMVQALRSKGLAVAYVPFAGEQHGFRKADTIKRALSAELYFYSRVFGFALAEAVEAVNIENL
jgi:dipeptidyl aminopeptidase/acylaminoacyl peptidase